MVYQDTSFYVQLKCMLKKILKLTAKENHDLPEATWPKLLTCVVSSLSYIP